VTGKLSEQTAIIHSDYVAPEGFNAFPLAVHRASTVVFENVAAMRSRTWQEKSGYTYGLHGTPTSFTLEAWLAEIEGGTHCMLAPSGLAAISMIDMALLKTGDDMLIPDNAYNPNRDLGQWLARDFGVSVRFYDPLIGAGIRELIKPNTRLIWTEAPGSVTMEVPDIPAICAAARSAGADGQRPWVALDNTWSAGLAFKPFDHGVDISMQALTKYQSGGSDVLMGAVITRNPDLVRKIEHAHMRLGVGVGMDDCYLVSRGLPNMKLRFKAHDDAARRVAGWLKTRPEIDRVLHPAFEDCPGHALWKRDFTGAGGLFSVIFNEKYPESLTDRFVDNLALFKIGYSWGGSHSLCVPYRVQGMRNASWTHKGQLVRFYIGLEDPEDLIKDIEQAMLRLSEPA
jgi:cysteine-S-conjugate beta-lyase